MSKFQLSYILQIVYIFYRCKCIKIKTAHLFYWYLEYMSILSLILIIYLFISTKMYAFLAVWEEWKKYRELWVMQLIQEKVGITPRWRRSLFAPLTLEKPGEAAGHCVLPTGELAKCLEKSCRKVLLSPKRWHPTEGLANCNKNAGKYMFFGILLSCNDSFTGSSKGHSERFLCTPVSFPWVHPT